MPDKKKFSDLVLKNQNVIHKITYIYSDTHEDREDLFQEICLQLWKSYGNFKSKSKFSTWAYKVALNTALSFIRKRNKRAETKNLRFESSKVVEDTDDEINSKKLFKAISKLNKIDRAIIMLWLEETSYEEIASIMGMSKSNVSVKLVRIKKALSEMINNSN